MLKIILGLAIFLLGPMFGMGFIMQMVGSGFILWGIIGIIRGNNSKVASSFAEGYKYSFSAGNTGIAISPERKLLKLKEKSNLKEYGFDMIRSWESNNQTGGHVVNMAPSLASAATTASANLGQNIANKRASGFFVYTKDIENVTWRVEMFDPKEQAKWMEIMRQSINEN